MTCSRVETRAPASPLVGGGKGPTKAKVFIVDDTLVCILEGGFTPVERTLIEQGRGDTVHEVRLNFQKLMEPEFTRLVEETTGRSVIAFMTQAHHDPDLAVEVFVLDAEEPVAGEYEVVLD
ncbi:MAG: DUF2294 domain-containing protein [Solirubrobacterales bacterium]